MQDDSKPARFVAWLKRRGPELAIFIIGVWLRCTMRWSYDPAWSYDAGEHWKVVEWMLERRRMPWPSEILDGQHPPLFYAVAAALVKIGVSRNGVVWLPIACGTVRLALVWLGLELHLPSSRWARLSALALSAVLPASIHIDGMIYPEAMSCLWFTAAMVTAPFLFRTGPQWPGWPVCTGVFLGLGMLTKISGLVVIASLGTAAVVSLLASKGDWRSRVATLAPCTATLITCVAVSGWYFTRNVRTYGRPFVTSFEMGQEYKVDKTKPYWKRRPRTFFVGWTSAIYKFPYYPAGIVEKSRFFPVAVASTFVDYWNYSFSGIDPSTSSPSRVASYNPLSPRVLAASRFAAVGGTVIFVATCAAWSVCVRAVFRLRDWGRLSLLLIPFFTAVAAIHFAVAYTIDNWGVVKGVYMQFGMTPLAGVFGTAVAWSQRNRKRWALCGMLLAALWLVATYAIYCRTRIPLLPLGPE